MDTCQCAAPDLVQVNGICFCAHCGGDISPERAALILFDNAHALDLEAAAHAAYDPMLDVSDARLCARFLTTL